MNVTSDSVISFITSPLIIRVVFVILASIDIFYENKFGGKIIKKDVHNF